MMSLSLIFVSFLESQICELFAVKSQIFKQDLSVLESFRFYHSPPLRFTKGTLVLTDFILQVMAFITVNQYSHRLQVWIKKNSRLASLWGRGSGRGPV